VPALRGLSATQGTIRTAPAAVMANQPRRFLSYGNVFENGSQGARISGCLPLYGICAEATTGAGLRNVSGTNFSSIFHTPANGDTLSPQLSRIVSCFARWRFRKLRFVYAPMGSTASGVRLAFAYSCDPLSSELYSSSALTYTNYNALLTTPHSVQFSPWAGWVMDVPCTSEFKYTRYSSTTVSANTRDITGGIMACLADSDPGTTFSYGTLWVEFVLDVIDSAPLSTVYTGPPTTSSSLSSQVSGSDSTESKAVTSGGLSTGPADRWSKGLVPVETFTSSSTGNSVAAADTVSVPGVGSTTLREDYVLCRREGGVLSPNSVTTTSRSLGPESGQSQKRN